MFIFNKCFQLSRLAGVIMAVTLLFMSTFLTGCFGDDKASETKDGTTKVTAEKKAETTDLWPYLEAGSNYNANTVTFDFAISPSLDALRNGDKATHISLPNFDTLEKMLKKAKESGSSGFADIDKSADKVLAVLKDLVPLAEKIEGYYDAKGYMSDDYAKSREYTAQFLPLYDQFNAVYDEYDELLSRHNKELKLELLKELRDNGFTVAANFTELNMKLNEAIEVLELEQPDMAKVEKLLQEILALNDNLSSEDGNLKSYKSGVNNFVGAVRSYMADSKDWNDLVEDYNRLIDKINRVDLNTLDPKK